MVKEKHQGIVSCRVTENGSLCRGIRRISVKGSLPYEAGQFVMVWLPGVGEKPFALVESEKKISMCIKEVGNFTERLSKVKKGGILGIRGPLGKGFTCDGVKKALLVGGGIGAVPLVALARELRKKGCETDIISGARCADEVLFEEHFRKCGRHCVITDDGSSGRKGFATELLAEMCAKKEYDMVYACGPEMMMKNVLDFCLAKKIRAEFSLERFMKCGIGICGQCALDGLLVCRDGPVFSSTELAESQDFGNYAYNKAGRKVSLGEFYRKGKA
jgi:dihydroorotate dehydrogenase electron transfer subunit